jgi:hypothetical protein
VLSLTFKAMGSRGSHTYHLNLYLSSLTDFFGLMEMLRNSITDSKYCLIAHPCFKSYLVFLQTGSLFTDSFEIL